MDDPNRTTPVADEEAGGAETVTVPSVDDLVVSAPSQQEIDDRRGYREMRWHGKTLYQLVYAADRTFTSETDAQAQVAADRAQAAFTIVA